MEHWIRIFERRQGGILHWHSVSTPWRTPIVAAGSTRAKVEKVFVEATRTLLARLSPAERSELPPPESVHLHELRLELSLRGEGGRRAFHGAFPFVQEARGLGPGPRASVLLHPYRPEDRVVLPAGATTAETMRRALSVAWADLSDEELRQLVHTGKERLHAIAIDVPMLGLRASRQRREPDVPRLRPTRPPLVELRKVGTDLTHRAATQDRSPLAPRPALDRALGAMLLPPRHAPHGAEAWQVPPTARSFVVVGASGTGRTSAIERAVELLLEHDGYAVTRNLDLVSKVFRLSARTVIAGMSRYGEWEQRVLKILDECRAHRGVLAFDDVALLGSVGRSRESDRSFADVIEGYVARGEVAIWGEATREGMQRLGDEAPRLAALLTRLPLAPPEPGETTRLLFFRARAIERDAGVRLDAEGRPHRVEIDPVALPAVVAQARALFGGVAEPQRSMQVLTRLAARLSSERDEAAAGGPTGTAPSPEVLVLETLAERSGMPLSLLDGSALDADGVAAELARDVVGQPEAARAVSDLFVRVKARLTDPRRPRAVYLFTGPTGTGKTETAKWIARHLYGDAGRLVRFDMAEYAAPGSAARLVQGPLGTGLVARIREQPFSVLLFDEIEKADRSVLYLLLQLFDEGRLADASGVGADFTAATIVMTSNLGAKPEARAGFASSAEVEHAALLSDVAKAVREFFPPELFHRIDRVVPFRPIDAPMAGAIVRRELARLFARRGLTERRIAASATDAVVDLAVAEAFDARRGARSVKAWLEAKLGSLLAERITRTGRAEQRELVVYVEDGHLAVHTEALGEAEPRAQTAVALPPADDLEAWRALVERFGDEVLDDAVEESLRSARRRAERLDPAAVYPLEQAALRLAELREEHERLLRPDEEREREEWEEAAERGIRIERGRTHRGRERRPRLSPGGIDLDARSIHTRALRAHLSELLELRRALPPSDEPGAHTVDVWVGALGERGGARSFASTLALAIARWGGALHGLVGEDADGRVRSLSRPDAGVTAVVARIAGLDVRRKVGAEVGTQVVLADDAAPELLAVRLLPHDPGRVLDQTFASMAAARRAFLASLERGPKIPSPAPLLPRLRTIRLERRLDAQYDVTIEDLGLGDVVGGRIRDLTHVLEPIHARVALTLPGAAP